MIKTAAAVTALAPFVRDPDIELRHCAVIALGHLGPLARDTAPDMLALADAANPRARRSMLRALVRVDAADTAELRAVTRRMLADPERLVVRSALALVRRLGAKDFIDANTACLGHADGGIRLSAARCCTCGVLEAPHLLRALRRALRDPILPIRYIAARALARVSRAGITRGLVIDVMDRLADRDWFVVQTAARTLVELGPTATRVAPEVGDALARAAADALVTVDCMVAACRLGVAQPWAVDALVTWLRPFPWILLVQPSRDHRALRTRLNHSKSRRR